MNETVLSEKERRFIDIVKSKMTGSDTQADLEAVIFPAILSLDGENDNPIFDDLLRFVEEHPELTLQQIGDHVFSMLPPVEIMDDSEDDVPA